MAGLPTFPPPVEHAVLRFCCSLPRPLKRLFFGRRPVVDGNRLDSDMQVVLALSALAGRTSLTAGHTPEQARKMVLADARAGSGRPVPMASVRELTYDGATGPLAARLYVPHGSAPAPRPLLIYFHGGGWVVGSLETHDSVCRYLAARSGVSVLAASYRMAPEHPYPAAVEDAAAAFAWAIANAAELGIDPTRIAVGGDSAGGNMAAGVAIGSRDFGGPAPAMQLLIYPVTDVDGKHRSRALFGDGFKLTSEDIAVFERCYVADPSRGHEPLASVLHAPSLANLPPAYIATAGFDPLRDEGDEYAERMRAAGVQVAHRRHPTLIHTFANMTSFSPAARTAMSEAAGALRMGLA